MKTSGLTRILAAVAAATALTVTTVPAHAQESKAGDPMFGAPTVGTCSTMTPSQTGAKTDQSTVVPCSQKHTAKVAGVVQMPAKVSYSDGFNALYRVVADRCLPQLNTMLGRTYAVRDSSAYIPIWFEPTKAQQANGAHWLSCSIILAHATTLAPLPTDTTPLLPSGKLGNNVAHCLRTVRSTLFSTTCSARHTWRATGSFVVAGKYPGTKTLNKVAQRKCLSRIQAHTPRYRWLYQDKITWNVGGDHVVVCYSETRR